MERSRARFGFEEASLLSARGWLIVGGVLIVAIVGLAIWSTFAGPHATPTAKGPSAEEDTAEGAKLDVHLTPEKIAASGIRIAEVRAQQMRAFKTVAGTIDYDPALRLELTTPVDCLIADVFVQPGEEVKTGQRLVTLVSEEAGRARDEIGRGEDELRVTERAFNNADEILKNVTALLPQLESAKSRIALEDLFRGKKLGEHREHLFVAYAKYAAAQQVWNESEALVTAGTLSGRIATQRKADLEIARIGAITQQETTLFECQQVRDLASAEVAQAKRRLEIAKSKLRTLLGALQIEPDGDIAAGENLSRLTVVAPQAGRVEDHLVVKNQRLKIGERVLTIGDASKMWLSASIHERDWPAAQLQAGERITFRLPALEAKELSATVRFIGARVRPETRSLALVADIDNADGSLKPGMFAWVDLPIESPHETLVVPASAVTYHDNQPFVFQEISPENYRRIDVKLGHVNEELVEVESGLSAGNRIVVDGVFQLKSELLLEQEEE